MSPHTFATSPGARGEQRKFVNPTPGFVGANVFGADGKPTAIAVEPGGEVWLTAEEERMTAEAPRDPADNPFIKAWEEPTGFDTFGEVASTAHREGILVLTNEPPRPTASDRFIPEREAEAEPESEPEEVTGADVPEQPPVEGQPSPDEIVGTPEAAKANQEAVAARKPTREQPVAAGAIPTE